MTIEQNYEPAHPIENLLEHPDNPRRGDEDAIEASMDAHGFFGAVLVQTSTNRIIAGNHRTRVARRRGETTVPVLFLDVDDDQARRILLVDNRTSDDANYDERALTKILVELDADGDGTLDGTGYDAADLARLIGRWGGHGDPDDAPDPPVKARTKPGDLYTLGRHRILCGDSCDPAHVERLLDGLPTPKLMVTDPPYLVDYTGENHPQSKSNKGMHGKRWDSYSDPTTGLAFYVDFLRIALEHIDDNAPIYQWHATRRQDLVQGAWDANNVLWHQTLYWYKSRPVPTHSDFMWSIEPAAFGWIQRPDAEPDPDDADAVAEIAGAIDAGIFAGAMDAASYGWKIGNRPTIRRRPPLGQENVWRIDNASANAEHPTIKPLQLYTDPYTWHLRAGEYAYEPFSGSGTAIAAAEVTGRGVAAMEIQPIYVDVACERWQKITGQKPLLDGDPVDFSRET